MEVKRSLQTILSKKKTASQDWEYLETHFAAECQVKNLLCGARLFSLSWLFPTDKLRAHWIRDYSLQPQKVLEQTKYLCGSKFSPECSKMNVRQDNYFVINY
jgi:hypothetical protein